MPLSDLQAMSYQDPARFDRIMRAFARRSCRSLSIEGIQVDDETMMAQLKATLIQRVAACV